MEDTINEFIEILQSILPDLPSKVRPYLEEVLSELEKPMDSERLMKVQDELEAISNMPNIDDYSRTEIFNIVTLIEGLYNS